MAYKAQIEIAVKGQKQLLKLQKQLDKTANKIKEINKQQVDLKAQKSLDIQLQSINKTMQRQNTLLVEQIALRDKATASLNKYNSSASRTRKVSGGGSGSRAGRRLTGRRFQDIATGAGFPLLFGGGPLQAVAGGLGGAVGGLGGSIAASALTAQAEALAQAATQTGQALNSTGDALDLMREKSLFSSKQIEEQARILEKQGDVAALSSLLTQELVDKIGNKGVEALQGLGRETDETTRLWAELTLQLQALIAGPLKGFLSLVNEVLGNITRGARVEAFLKDTGAQEAEARKRFDQLTGRNLGTGRSGAKARAEASAAGTIISDEAALAQLKKEFPVAATANIPITAQDRERFAQQEQKREQAKLNLRKLEVAANKELYSLQIKEANLKDGSLAAIQKEREILQFTVQDKKEQIELERQKLLKANEGFGLDERINKLAERKVLLAEESARLTDQELQKKATLLELERALDSQRVKTAQNAQLTQSAENLERAELKLANPFGGNEYERQQQRIKQEKELRDIRLKAEKDLQNLRSKLNRADPGNKGRIAQQIKDQEKVNETIEKEARARQQVEQAILRQQQVLEQLQPVTNALASGISDLFVALVDGSKSAEEAFADMLQNMGKALIDQAAIMIAQYIAIGIARSFAGLGTAVGEQSSLPGVGLGSGDGSFTNIAGNEFSTLGPNFGFRTRAVGGPVNPGGTYLVGERGPELLTMTPGGGYVTSNSSSRAAMSRYNTSNTADSTPTFRLETTVINGVEYATVDQVREMGAISAKRGAQMGQSNTMKSLQNSRSQRSRIGMR